MSIIRSALFLLFISTPLSISAAVTTEDLPAGTVWYLHADLEQMRTQDAGRALYEWLDEEVFVETYKEFGINIKTEADSITAYSTSELGTVILVEGPISEKTIEKLVAVAESESNTVESTYKGNNYFFVEGESHRPGSKEPFDDLQEGGFFSFAIKNKLLVTGSEEQMKDLLDHGGKISGGGIHGGALFVLTAERAFVQAGLNTDELDDDDNGWDSNILRNTEQVALTIAGVDDMISIEAQLVAADPTIAESLGGIANGLISLQAFNSGLDPELKSLLANTKVDVAENVISIRTVITADVIVRTLNH